MELNLFSPSNGSVFERNPCHSGVDQRCKTSFRLTVISAKDIFENPSEFINNIGDNFNAIMQTKSSRRIREPSQHRARFIKNRSVKILIPRR